MTNSSWGTKRNCPSCSVHFYDLNKTPAVCPKCSHQFDPTLVMRAKRKSPKREAPEGKKEEILATILAKKISPAKKKDKKQADADMEAGSGGLSDIAEIEDVDDIENLQDLSELEEIEESSVNGDDTDDEAIIEELNTGEKALVENVEDEEAKAHKDDLSDEEDESVSKKKLKVKKKSK